MQEGILIGVATRWGTTFGGINSFNFDLLSAIAVAYHPSVTVVCLVNGQPTAEESKSAGNTHVRLVASEIDLGSDFAGADEYLHDLLFAAGIRLGSESVWLGHDRITGAAAISGAKCTNSRVALVHHMSYAAYESYAESSDSAHRKETEQRHLFGAANFLYAVGPLLTDALKDLVGTERVTTLVPGLANIEPRETPPKTFTAIMSGRIGPETTKIKQAQLAIAAFSALCKDGSMSVRGASPSTNSRLILRGVEFEEDADSGRNIETELKRFAQKYAERVINLQTLSFTHDRKDLYHQLSSATAALMPSWHEGFGLVGWEAISAAVPLIVSKESGVYRWLNENVVGADGLVWPVDVHGSVDEPFFAEQDLKQVKAALGAIAIDPLRAKIRAAKLRAELSEYTWQKCAISVCEPLGFKLPHETFLKVGSASAATLVPPNPDSDPKRLVHLPQPRWRSGIHTVSQLLRAEEAIVPFDPARQPELSVLQEWTSNSEHSVALRLLVGEGGQGKTRLALQLCTLLSANGWNAGFLDDSTSNEEIERRLVALRSEGKPTLIVLDYAETRQSMLLGLVSSLLLTPTRQVARVLLLARDAGRWWERLPSLDARTEGFFSGYATSGPFRLASISQTPLEREVAYRGAANAFAAVLGLPEPLTVPELDGDHLGRPLFLHMTALLALHRERAGNSPALTDALLNHEARYWRSLSVEPLAPARTEDVAERLLTLATLCGGFISQREAYDVFRAASVKDASDVGAEPFSLLFASLATLYPGEIGLEAVKPDLLGEALVARHLIRISSTVLDAAMNSSNGSHRRNALVVFDRLVHHRTAVSEQIAACLARHLPKHWADMLGVAQQTRGQLGKLLVAAFAMLDQRTKLHMAGVLNQAIQIDSLQLNSLDCAVCEFRLQVKLEKWAGKKLTGDALFELAALHSNYGSALAHLGRFPESLKQTHEAVNKYALVPLDTLKRGEQNYGRALTNYAVRLAQNGRAPDATFVRKKAVDVWRRLAERDSTFLHEYAAALIAVAFDFGRAGNFPEAFGAALKGKEIHLRLAHKNPARYELDYAVSITNYAQLLSNSGRVDEALPLEKTALEIHKRYAEHLPDQYEANYGHALGSHAIRLGEAGKYTEAINFLNSALDIFARLSDRVPERFERHKDSLFATRCFVKWLNGEPVAPDVLPDGEPPSLMEYEKVSSAVYRSFVKACLHESLTARNACFSDTLLNYWRLTEEQKYDARAEILCTATWLSSNGFPSMDDLPKLWGDYLMERSGLCPAWVSTVLSKLRLEPAEMQASSVNMIRT